jgi:acyl-coenzyme A thioesterase PaaI-like protein
MLLGRPLPTVNFRVDYLRPAIDTALVVTATVRRSGRLVGVVDVDVANEAGKYWRSAAPPMPRQRDLKAGLIRRAQ